MHGPVNIEVDSRQCIYFLNIRDITKYGVLRMTALYTGKYRDIWGAAGRGITIGSYAAIFGRLADLMGHFVSKPYV